MTKRFYLALAVAAAFTANSTAPVWSQAAQPTDKPADNSSYTPTRGQQGKDVIWLPSAESLVDRMLSLAEATPNDFLVDLGSGDGRTVITAAKRGIRAMGVEYNGDLVGFARKSAEAAGVGDKATFVQGDIFQTDFSKATVLTLFLLPELNRRLSPTILNMKPGTRVVSNTFDMGDWEPDERAEAVSENCTTYCRALLWIVPAKVEGLWQLPKGELKLAQAFQKLSGTLNIDGQETPIADGRMKGDAISFTARGKSYTGKVDGNTMTVSEANGTPLTGTRATPAAPAAK